MSLVLARIQTMLHSTLTVCVRVSCPDYHLSTPSLAVPLATCAAGPRPQLVLTAAGSSWPGLGAPRTAVHGSSSARGAAAAGPARGQAPGHRGRSSGRAQAPAAYRSVVAGATRDRPVAVVAAGQGLSRQRGSLGVAGRGEQLAALATGLRRRVQLLLPLLLLLVLLVAQTGCCA